MIIKKILYTLLLIAYLRIGNFFPVQYVDQIYLYETLKNNSTFQLFTLFFQGRYFLFSIFSLGILPNINASVFMQFLVSIIPFFKQIQKEEGENGRKKITQYTRYLTVLISFYYSGLIAVLLKPYVFDYTLAKAIEIFLILSAGSIVTMWFSELITEKGIGNGSSLIIFINITSSLPKNLESFLIPKLEISKILIILLSLVGIIFVQNSTKIVPILSTKSMMSNSNTNYLTNQSYIPFRLIQGGVFPIIFATTFLTLFVNIFGNIIFFKNFIEFSSIFLYFGLILLFNLFYSGISLNADELTEDLNKMGFIVPDIRPGLQTKQYILQITNRLSLLGGLFLAIIATTPNLIGYFDKNVDILRSFSATSLLILVGVAIDLNRQIRASLLSEYYKTII
jgi:preprotein translocase subunit SecY|tara:strand:- start:24510 stop:25694 length:1185 start_codon:yes stop_codon:yes gene_type:complete